MASLGKLERVDLRAVWEKEAQDFTPWLAREENLEELGRAIGLELEVVAQEQNVGPYRADLVCKDALTQGYVLIENQLEKTNHNHLGQILTYAAGLGAKTVVWMAERITDDHRAALDWLNEITEEDYGFFAFEIVSAVASIEKQRLGAEMFIRPRDMDPKEAFRRLEKEKTAIETDTGFPLEWQELPDAKGSRIVSYLTGVRLDDETDWPRQFEWLSARLEGLDRGLRKRVRAL